MKLGITMLIHNKDDIEFVTEFPCFLGHPVHSNVFSFTTVITRKLWNSKTTIDRSLSEFYVCSKQKVLPLTN